MAAFIDQVRELQAERARCLARVVEIDALFAQARAILTEAPGRELAALVAEVAIAAVETPAVPAPCCPACGDALRNGLCARCGAASSEPESAREPFQHRPQPLRTQDRGASPERRPWDVTPNTVLRILQEGEKRTGAVAFAFGTSQEPIRPILKELLARGLVEVSGKTNGRLWRITDAGRAKLEPPVRPAGRGLCVGPGENAVVEPCQQQKEVDTTRVRRCPDCILEHRRRVQRDTARLAGAEVVFDGTPGKDELSAASGSSSLGQT